MAVCELGTRFLTPGDPEKGEQITAISAALASGIHKTALQGSEVKFKIVSGLDELLLLPLEAIIGKAWITFCLRDRFPSGQLDEFITRPEDFDRVRGKMIPLVLGQPAVTLLGEGGVEARYVVNTEAFWMLGQIKGPDF